MTLDLAALYHDLHAHPELSFQEARTAAVVARHLVELGYETTTEVGRTGVVGVLRNGSGPVAMLRADMDGLPVLEQTGLSYASAVRATDPDGHEVPVMHACGHDVHVTCLLGAAEVLAADRPSWGGTLVLVFQPAEEITTGAQTMVDDGLLERFPSPDVVLGQHVAPLPAGIIGLTPGPAFAAADALRVTLYGVGGHGSRPESSVDPVLLAAATVLRLQGIVSRELAGAEMGVLTIGALRAGTKANIIPDAAELLLSVRTNDVAVRARVLAAIERIVRAEAAASGAPKDPDIEMMESAPALVNDVATSARLAAAFGGELGAERVFDPGPVTGSEDVGVLAAAAGAPIAYWLLGGADPRHFAGARTPTDVATVVNGLPANHSPHFAPVPEPTLSTGVCALTVAARTFLPPENRAGDDH